MDLYKSFIRPILFRLDPEVAHEFVIDNAGRSGILSKTLAGLYAPSSDEGIKIGGLNFRNRLGLAAGFDKNGVALRLWDALGFSHAEIGTVTPLAQPGNEKPRLFRLKENHALINRMGFNNEGAEKVRQNIFYGRKLISKEFVIGVNIGKNKATSIEAAVDDYLKCFEKLYDVADYFTVNVSSPNTPGLRQLQEENFLPDLLNSLRSLNQSMSAAFKHSLKPMFLKISPDITNENIESIFDTCAANEITGIIATNTTISREGLRSPVNQEGGLSGAPVKKLSDGVLSNLNSIKRTSSYKPVLVGVGGVLNRDDYLDKISAGADLVQIYTGFIYEGPGIIKRLLAKK